jgi:hypothetical protein
VPLARRHLTRGAVLAACLLPAVTAGGCATTQETAEMKQAEAKRILAARKHRQQAKKHDQKTHDNGSKKR